MGKVTDQSTMLLRGNPYVAIAPAAEITQLLHFLMRMLNIVLNRQAGRIEDTNIAAEAEEDA